MIESPVDFLRLLMDLDRGCLPKDMAIALPELETLDFIRTGQNVIMYGNPGTGKTHCAIGLGIKACLAGFNVLYASAPRLLVQIKECESQRRLSRLQKRFEKYDLAILDECGYKSFDKAGAEQFFNHISLRAGIKSIIITANLGFDKWDQIFTDKIKAAAIVDRLTYKSYIVDMNALSYRIKATEEWIKETKIRIINTFVTVFSCSELDGKTVHFSMAIYNDVPVFNAIDIISLTWVY